MYISNKSLKLEPYLINLFGMSITHGKYSQQVNILRDTYSQLNVMWQKEKWNQSNLCMENMIDNMITNTVVIISNYQNNSQNELVRVSQKYAVSGEQYYDPADILESMRPFYYTTSTVYQSLCNLIERNINALGRQTDKTYKCNKVQVNIDNILMDVPVIPDKWYAFIYQIIAEYALTWL